LRHSAEKIAEIDLLTKRERNPEDSYQNRFSFQRQIDPSKIFDGSPDFRANEELDLFIATLT